MLVPDQCLVGEMTIYRGCCTVTLVYV